MTKGFDHPLSGPWTTWTVNLNAGVWKVLSILAACHVTPAPSHKFPWKMFPQTATEMWKNLSLRFAEPLNFIGVK